MIVPCHRVIGSDGSLTGFGGGLPRKKWLLAHEGEALRNEIPAGGCGMSGSEQTRVFRALHGEGLLILPNAWDAGSARVIEHAGANAIATSSAAVAWAHGYPDGEAVPADVLIATIREIVRVVNVPVTADIEAGYARDAEETADFVGRVIEAGAVGINIEDGSDRTRSALCQDRARVRRASDALWINARVDVYLRKLAEGEAAYDETITRARRYAEAGASSIFVPGASR